MAPNFDVIVIGSGFGAAVAAIDQAGKGKTVFVLERGVWSVLGKVQGYPRSKVYAAKQAKIAHVGIPLVLR